MNSTDIWTLVAHEKFGPLPEGWRWTKLQVLGGDGLPREKCISEITGCVVTEGPERFKSGPRKGKPKKKYDKTTERVFHITFGDFDAFCEEWERKNDKCHGCWGEGTTPWKWSKENGEETRTCSRCGGTGKPKAAP